MVSTFDPPRNRGLLDGAAIHEIQTDAPTVETTSYGLLDDTTQTSGLVNSQPGEQDPKNPLGELIVGLIILIVVVWLVAKLADAFLGQFANNPELTSVEKQILASA